MQEAFGPYTLIQRIATGGMGEIFLAKLERGPVFEKLLVIKRILPHFANDQQFVRLFENEARIAAQLTHQNIVQIYDFGAVGDSTYMAMEYVHGEDTRSILTRANDRGGPIPLAYAVKIVGACLRALDYAHRKADLAGQPLAIVHRDISLQNILVSFEGEVKLTDFGLAKAAQAHTESQTGSLKGKYSYMSPEQVTGKPLTGASDLFSVGVTLYELATGRRLYPMELGIHEVLERIRTAALPDFASEPTPRLPEWLAGFLERALARTPADRFASAGEMEGALLALARAEGLLEPTLNLAEYLRALFRERAQVSRQVFERTVVAGEAPLRERDGASDRTVTAPPGGRAASDDAPDKGEMMAFASPVEGSGRSKATSRLSPRGPATTRRPSKRALYVAALGTLAIALSTWFLWPPFGPNEIGSLPADGATEPATAGDAAAATATISIATDPPGASVAWNGAPFGKTPIERRSVHPGDHTVSIAADGFRAETRQVPVLAGEVLSLRYVLAREVATLAVSTTPRGATVFVDGERVPGTTPVSRASLRSKQSIRLRIIKDGFANIEETMELAAGTNEVVRTLATRRVRFELGDPQAAEVQDDGRRAPRGVVTWSFEKGLQLLTVTKGALRVTLRIDQLSGRRFRLSAASTPWADLTVDGEPANNPLLGMTLKYGLHALRFGQVAVSFSVRLE